MPTEDNDCETFFTELNDSLSSYCHVDLDTISAAELATAFPIQQDLKQLSAQYEKLELIGEGGMKQIFRYRDHKSDRLVAMAKLRKEAGAEAVERFLREARLTASLQHPNIIPVYDVGLEGESPYFTMELLQGQGLDQLLKEFYMDKNLKRNASRDLQLLAIFNKVCDAIAYSHSLEILHLDLKPENIHIGDFGEVYVCDWGIAKILNEDEEAEQTRDIDSDILNHVTIEGQIKGTPGFMAPEQVQSYGDKDTRTDIYALGALLYCLMTGKPPVEGDSLDEVLKKTASGQLTNCRVYEITKSLPASLEAIFMKALSLSANERYQNVTAMQVDLNKYLSGFATEAEEANALKLFLLLLKRHKKTVVSIVVFVVSLTVILSHSFQRIDQEREQALVEKAKAEKLQVAAEVSQAEAEQLQLEAMLLQHQAEKNLKLLINEQKLSEALRHDLDGLFDEVPESDDLSSAKRKIKLLEEGLKRASTRNKTLLWKRKGILHFVLQDFELALESFSYLNQNNSSIRLIQLAQQGADFRRLNQGEEALNDDQLALIFRGLGHKYAEVVSAMYHKHIKFNKKVTRDSMNYRALATAMLNSTNNIWENEKYDDWIDYESGKVNLRGRNYRHLCTDRGYGLNILAPFDLEELDLGYTAFFEFAQLRGLQLNKLNISGCKVNTIEMKRVDLMKSFGIKTVVYDSAFLSEEECALLDEHFETEDGGTK